MSAEDSFEYVTVHIGNQLFGVEVKEIREVFSPQDVTSVGSHAWVYLARRQADDMSSFAVKVKAVNNTGDQYYTLIKLIRAY